MEIERRDAFDLALVTTALILVFASSVSASNPANLVGGIVGAVTSVGAVTYLIAVGLGGVLFTAYVVLYLPSKSGR